MSVGVASVRPGGVASADGLIAAADKALYRAKEAGRDRIAVADSDVMLGGATDPLPAAA